MRQTNEDMKLKHEMNSAFAEFLATSPKLVEDDATLSIVQSVFNNGFLRGMRYEIDRIDKVLDNHNV